uniref:GTD-binding domain-containing protein n=1 Tax=Leersia perrieri TaxID=77586 RepID=A0A0D9XTH4_9ORYZ
MGDDDDACPLCGGPPPPPPSRVTMHKRRMPVEGTALAVVARVGIGDEAAVLREAVARQQAGIAELHAELEAERGAAAGAASEAMSMILRLQREKSECMMEARQFRRYAEERFAHDAGEAAALREEVARRDAAVESLAAQLRACRFRLAHLGFLSPDAAAADDAEGRFDDDDDDDGNHDYFVEHPESSDVGTPRTHHLLNRMSPRASAADKGVICSSSNTLFPDDGGIAMADEFPLIVDREELVSDQEDDGDRVYTVDAVHGVPVAEPNNCCYIGKPVGSETSYGGTIGAWSEEEEIQKLSARLQALEADRESMRHAIMSMGSEKAQVVLLREIAQKLCKEAAPLRAVPVKVHSPPQPVVVAQRKVVKRQGSFVKFFVVAVIKWIASVFCWRRKSNRVKYPIGMCGSNVGLMLLLNRFPKQRHRRASLRPSPKSQQMLSPNHDSSGGGGGVPHRDNHYDRPPSRLCAVRRHDVRLAGDRQSRRFTPQMIIRDSNINDDHDFYYCDWSGTVNPLHPLLRDELVAACYCAFDLDPSSKRYMMERRLPTRKSAARCAAAARKVERHGSRRDG